jgi:ribosomal protein S18 acetylase RimI-like enzyme
MIDIRQADDPAAIEAARGLFREYQEALGVDLGFQGFDAELAGLPGEYATPRGRLLLAYVDGALAGCVALRPLGADACEMKRLYVRPAFRADGVGRRLVERVMNEAGAQGYRRMCLDTLPTMDGAQRLYERLGFTDIPAYRHNPIAGSRFLGLDLGPNESPRADAEQ